jgi:hypothetical protein
MANSMLSSFSQIHQPLAANLSSVALALACLNGSLNAAKY